MADEATVRKVVERFFEFTGADVARAEELYHEDAVLEFPQSGERFEGRATFTDWRSQYPVGPDDLRYRVTRIVAREDFAATECWEAPEWRAKWRSTTRADPPA